MFRSSQGFERIYHDWVFTEFIFKLLDSLGVIYVWVLLMGNLEPAEGRFWDDGEESTHGHQQLVWSIKDTTVSQSMEKVLCQSKKFYVDNWSVSYWGFTMCPMFFGGIIQDGYYQVFIWSTFVMQSAFGPWHALRWRTYFWKWMFCVAVASVRFYLLVISALSVHSWRSHSCLAKQYQELMWNTNLWKLGWCLLFLSRWELLRDSTSFAFLELCLLLC